MFLFFEGYIVQAVVAARNVHPTRKVPTWGPHHQMEMVHQEVGGKKGAGADNNDME